MSAQVIQIALVIILIGLMMSLAVKLNQRQEKGPLR